MDDFVPFAMAYGEERNFVNVPGNRQSVSLLSPYIRTRLLTEREITTEVLKEHGLNSAAKFLQEIAWRTYWKGWLEMRPAVWDHYRNGLRDLERSVEYHDAITGATGIDCFDQWARELLEIGYLHNHVRMWFASIWIFTLKLPWQLGADFFLTHLLDADPASNTLSWRWVAGLHTPGKHYLARAANIEKFTRGQFNPVGELNEVAEAVALDRTFEIQSLSLPRKFIPQGRIGHLMFPEDLSPPPPEIGRIHATAAFVPPVHLTNSLTTAFIDGAINDVLTRTNGTKLEGEFSSALSDWMGIEKLEAIIVSYPTVGHTRDYLKIHQTPIPHQAFVREWDRHLWPKATAGFFRFRKALPDFYHTLMNTP